MLRLKWLTLIAIVLVATLAVFAGESGKSHDHQKCALSTQDCLDKMASMMKGTGWIGVELDMDEDTGVATVKRVFPGSPAEGAGIQPNDVLYALNGIRIVKENYDALDKTRKDWQPGQKVTYTIQRDGREHQVTMTLAPWPADVLAKYIGEHMLEHANGGEIAQNTKK
jgi:C-terminal processing protease CtpA/Prc